jgi:hypothetical protein
MAENPAEAGFPFVPQAAVSEGIVHEVVNPVEIFSSLMAHRDRRAA